MKTVEVTYPTAKGLYVNGMKEGDWISFDQDGKIKETIRYKEGDEVH
jgi:antitoxin component YwqK of YwqJK toxin-antitoxin module